MINGETLFIAITVWLSLFAIYDVIVTAIDSEKLNKAVHKESDFMYSINFYIFY